MILSRAQAFGGDLRDAQACCNAYKSSRNQPDLNQAWDLYYHVFRRIYKQLQQMQSLELHYVSPNLETASDLELCIPGQYRPNAPLVRIKGFTKILKVISSKQRPRRLTIRGSDGLDYKFLLKGHEDLRQDERVMQLFGLVNTLLANDRETSYTDLSIEKYPVIPLSWNAGLIGWLDHAETFHSLIREYRDSHKVKIASEHMIMMQMTTDYDHLALIQKVEVFEHALDNTEGQDLNKVFFCSFSCFPSRHCHCCLFLGITVFLFSCLACLLSAVPRSPVRCVFVARSLTSFSTGRALPPQGFVAEFCQFGGVAGPAQQLHTVLGCHVDGGVHPGAWRPAPQQFDAAKVHREGRAH